MSNGTRPVVVGVNGGEGSRAALRYACRVATERDASVEVVHCWGPTRLPDLVLATSMMLHRRSQDLVAAEIAHVVADLERDGDPVPELRAHSLPGRTVTALLERAAPAQELVLGADGRQSHHAVVFGQVVAGALRRARCTVTVVDPDGVIVGRREATRAAR